MKDYLMKTLLRSILFFGLLCVGQAPAMGQTLPGSPVYQTWSPQANSPSISISNASSAHLFPGLGPTAHICNRGSVDVYVNPYGLNNTITATTSSYYIQAGTCQNYNIKPSFTQYTYFAAITASGSTTLYVETGLGAPVGFGGNGGSPPVGAAGGDLGGAFPNPTVQTYNGGTSFGTTASKNTGASVVDPGTGTLEQVAAFESASTGSSKSFGASDLFKRTRRSNSGTAMMDTFPASSTMGLVNGTWIYISNGDVVASDTITAGSGTTFSGGSTMVIPPGRGIMFTYDTTGGTPTWRSNNNDASALVSSLGSANTSYYLPVDSVATMIALAQPPITGRVCTLAYYVNGATGGGCYHWVSAQPWTADTGTCVPSTATGYTLAGCWLREGLDGGLDCYWFGCYGDNSHDDSTAMNNAGSAACNITGVPHLRLNISPARNVAYKMASSLNMPCNGFGIWASGLGSLLRFTADVNGVINTAPFVLDNASIHDLDVASGINSSTGTAYYLPNVRDLHIYDVQANDFNIGYDFLIGMDFSVTNGSAESYGIYVSGCTITTRTSASAVGVRAHAYASYVSPTTAYFSACGITTSLGIGYDLQSANYHIDGGYVEGANIATCFNIDSSIGGSSGNYNAIGPIDCEGVAAGGYSIKADSTSTNNYSIGVPSVGAVSDASHKNNFNGCPGGATPNLALNSTTPSVSGCQTFATHCNSACSITTLPDMEYQWGNMPPYTIICADTNTTFVNSSTFKMKGGANASCTAIGQVFSFTRYSSTVEVQSYAPN